MRSSSSFQHSVPRYNLEFGSRAFRIAAPKIWNLLPASIRNSPSLPTFRRHLKTHYFQSAYRNPLMTTHSQHALILYRRQRFTNHLLTYLLTVASLRLEFYECLSHHSDIWLGFFCGRVCL